MNITQEKNIAHNRRQFIEPCAFTVCPNTATNKLVKTDEHPERGYTRRVTIFLCEECYLENENDMEGLLQ